MASDVVNDFELATEETYLREIDRVDRGPEQSVLTFEVGGEVGAETYGIDILDVREIIKIVEITEVPRTPPFLLGIISVRGAIIPVVDLRLRLQLPAPAPGRRARTLVVMRDNQRYGLLVDAVGGVVRFSQSEIEPAPTTLVSQDASYLSGIARQGEGADERIVVLLDLAAVVSFEVDRRRRDPGAR
jgi:purine-binding chemotaxis protein CheW